MAIAWYLDQQNQGFLPSNTKHNGPSCQTGLQTLEYKTQQQEKKSSSIQLASHLKSSDLILDLLFTCHIGLWEDC